MNFFKKKLAPWQGELIPRVARRLQVLKIWTTKLRKNLIVTFRKLVIQFAQLDIGDQNHTIIIIKKPKVQLIKLLKFKITLLYLITPSFKK